MTKAKDRSRTIRSFVVVQLEFHGILENGSSPLLLHRMDNRKRRKGWPVIKGVASVRLSCRDPRGGLLDCSSSAPLDLSMSRQMIYGGNFSSHGNPRVSKYPRD